MSRLVAAAALLVAAMAAHADTLAPPPGWRLVWADEFDTDGPPDPAKWQHDSGRNKEGWHNNELQYYGAANAEVRGGRLVITARKESPSQAADWGGQRYTSARLITRGRASWTYGFFEVRARVACGRGTWPAIWLLGTGGRWPDDGELDIVETMGRLPHRASSAVHTRAGSGGRAVGGATRLPDVCNAFHDYQMRWTRDAVSFGIDGIEHLHYPRLEGAPGAWPFDAPHFLIINVAIGGDLGGPVDDTIFPTTMEVEHVRVWQPPK